MNVDRVMNPDRSELPKAEVIKWVVYGFRDGAYFSLKIRGALPGIRRWTLSLPTRGPVVILQSRTPIRCIAVVMVAWAPFAGAVPGLEACVEIDEDAARLACYDRVAGRAPGRVQPPVAGAATAAATAPMPASAAAPVAASVPAAAVPVAVDVARDFGLSDADVRRRDAEQGAEAPSKSITRTVKSVSRDGYDRFVVTLDDGQVWAQTEQKSGAYPRPGDSVTITQGPMGGFGLRSERFGTVRVRRLK